MATKDGIQLRSFMKMLERVSMPKDESTYSYADNDSINYVKMTTAQQRVVQNEINQKHFFELLYQAFLNDKWTAFFNLKFY